MATTFRPQFAFTSGQIDEELSQRGDLESYYKSLKTAENCLCKLTGGIKRRYGTKYLSTPPPPTSFKRDYIGDLSIPHLATGVAENIKDDDRFTTIETTPVSEENFVIFSYEYPILNDTNYINLWDVKLVGGTATSTQKIILQRSIDGVVWTNAYAGSNSGDEYQYNITTLEKDIAFKVGGSYKAYRLIATSAFDAGVSLSQFEHYGYNWTGGKYRILDYVSRSSSIDYTSVVVFGGLFADVYNSDTGDRISSFYTGKTGEQISKCDYETDLDGVLIFTASDVKPFQIIKSGGSENSPSTYDVTDLDIENIPMYEFLQDDDFDPAYGTLTPSVTTGYVKMTASAGTPFAGAQVGWKISVEPVGRVRITEVVSDRIINGLVEQKLQDTNPIGAGKWTIQKGWEPLISTLRGWPSTLCFFSGRLYLGGTRQMPDLLMASTVENNFDFDIGDQGDSDGFWRQMGSKVSSNIYMLHARNTLEIYCDQSVYIISTNTAITPTSVKLSKVSSVGIKRYSNADSISDGGALYMNNRENSIYWMVYSDDKFNYDTKIVSELSSLLVSSPGNESYYNVRIWNGDDVFRNNYLVFVDSDSNLVFASILISENVKSFTRVIVNERGADGEIYSGNVKYMTPANKGLFMIVEFPQSGRTEVLKFDSSRYLDSSLDQIIYSNGKTYSPKHSGYYADIIVSDIGEYLGSFPVVDGEITLNNTSYNGRAVEIGCSFLAEIETMPIENVEQIGSSIGKSKNISEIYINPENISNLYINDKKAFDYNNDNSINESFVNRTVSGWGRDKSIKLSQRTPLEFSIRNMQIKAEVND